MRGLTVGQIDGVCTYPGKMAGVPGFSPVGSEELADALGIQVQVAHGRRRAARAAGGDRQRSDGGKAGIVPSRDMFPNGPMRRQRRPVPTNIPRRAAGELSGGHQLHHHAVLGDVGGQLGGAIRQPPRPQIRHEARTAGSDRDKRASQRRSLTPRAPRHLQERADAGRVHVGADYHFAVVPVGLRSVFGLFDGGDRVGRGRTG